jgi:membrane fusion protein (multidrug efflux system)
MKANPEYLSPHRDGTPVFDSDDLPDLEPGLQRDSKPAQPPPRLGPWLILGFVLLIGALAVGMVPRLKNRAEIAEDTRALSVPTVIAISPAPGNTTGTLTLSGELKPLAEASIYARANGYVRRWLVDLGAHVEAGQLLAELDIPEVNRELAQAHAELKQAEAAQTLAETTAKRWREMNNAKTVSAQEADEKIADAEVKKAAAETAAAHVQQLDEMVGFAKLTAPFAGTITVRKLDVGQLVAAGADHELFHLAQIDKLRVFVRVPQTHSRAVTVGQTAELTMTELPGRKFTAKVVRTAGALDASSRTLLTELEVDNSSGEIYAGGYAQVHMVETTPDAAITLPSNTLLFRPEGPQLAVVNDNHVTMRKVTLGRDFGSAIEILSGVTAADHVILNPADSIIDGAEVRVAETPKKP